MKKVILLLVVSLSFSFAEEPKAALQVMLKYWQNKQFHNYVSKRFSSEEITDKNTQKKYVTLLRKMAKQQPDFVIAKIKVYEEALVSPPHFLQDSTVAAYKVNSGQVTLKLIDKKWMEVQ